VKKDVEWKKAWIELVESIDKNTLIKKFAENGFTLGNSFFETWKTIDGRPLNINKKNIDFIKVIGILSSINEIENNYKSYYDDSEKVKNKIREYLVKDKESNLEFIKEIISKNKLKNIRKIFEKKEYKDFNILKVYKIETVDEVIKNTEANSIIIKETPPKVVKKKELIERVAKNNNIDEKVVKIVLDEILLQIKESLTKGERVNLSRSGLGNFTIVESKERINPFDKSKIIPAAKKIKFTSNKIKNAVNKK